MICMHTLWGSVSGHGPKATIDFGFGAVRDLKLTSIIPPESVLCRKEFYVLCQVGVCAMYMECYYVYSREKIVFSSHHWFYLCVNYLVCFFLIFIKCEPLAEAR